MADKPTIEPPTQPREFAPDPHESRLKRRALIAFIVLALIAVSVVVFLPGRHSPERRQARVTPETKPVQPHTINKEESSLKAAEAQELLNRTLEIKARLDSEGVKIWGAGPLVTSYDEAMGLLADANKNFDGRLFARAASGYQETITALEQLEASRPERLQRSLQAGASALDQLDASLAKQQFEIALAADPDNDEARLGLQRAENLPQVLEYIEQGRAHEESGSLDNAKQRYESACALDQECKAAQEHLRRINALIEERDFQHAFSEAMSAFALNNLAQARQALNSAKQFRPDTEEVRDLDRQIKNAERSAELQRLARQAAGYEQAEQWDTALNLYIQALKIDANAGFAQQGKVRAEKLAQVSREVQGYLSNPGELQAREHRDHARNLCDTAIALRDPVPTLKSSAEKLRRMVDLYNRPVPIILRSDDMTDVMIYRVGRFGNFLEHSLRLTPGRYKARGTRSGYRDVIIEFSVPTDSTGMTVEISCKELI
jgi:hypothetical protein